MQFARELARKLLQIKAIKLSPQSPFTWASGIKSPIYCDNRITLSHPEVRDFLVNGFVREAAAFEDVQVVAGVATAGIPHATLLADRLGLPLVYVRSKAKAHGRQNQIEGRLEAGKRVLVIEDLISTGGSSLQAVEALRAGGAEVVGALAIFTYGFQRAADAFAAANCSLRTLTNYDILIREAIESDYIPPEYLDLLEQWKAAPAEWTGINL